MNKALIPAEMDNRYLKQNSTYTNLETPNQTNIVENTYELQEIIEEECDELTNIIDVQEMVISENNFFIISDDLVYQDTRAICGSMNNIDVQGLENQELIEGDNPVYHKKNQKRLASKRIEVNSPIAKQTKISDAQVINIVGDESILNEHNSNSEGFSLINCMVNDNQHNISINKDVQSYSLEKNNTDDQAAQIKFENNSSNVKLKDEQNEGHPICQNLKIKVDNNLYQNKKHQNSETNLVVEGFINSKNEQVINLNIFLSSCEQPNERDNCRHIQSELFKEKSSFVCKCTCAPQHLKEQQLNSVIHHSNINKENAYSGSITTLNTKNIAINDVDVKKSATAYDVCTFPNNIFPKSQISLEHINKSFPALSEKNKEYKFYIRPIKEKVTENCALENLFGKNRSTPVNVNNECSGFKYIKKIYADQPLIDTTKNFDVEKNDTQLPKLDEKQPSNIHQNSIQNESLLSVVCGEQKNVRKTENRKNKNQEMNDLQLARQLHMELNRQEYKRSSLTK